ncbi:MAG: methionine synthase [Prevotella sp.]|nr:methionine synthase [Prevotella sp.]
MKRNEILDIMSGRILILDGGTGTYLQQLQLCEDDFRGEMFKCHSVPLKGCNDVLCLTQPHIIERMHRDYIEAGADIIETNSFNCNRFSLADYGLEDMVYPLSKAAAECARRAGEGVIVAGSIGPTNRTASMSADVNNPAQRDVTFQELYATYREQARGLVDGGADVLLIETVFDTLNAKAAMKAITDLGEERGVDIPIMVSGTLSDASGRTLSGQTVEAFVASLSHGNLLSIGLNCGFGARQLLPWLRRMAQVAPCPISVHPNAGLPNVMGGYDETPETFAKAAEDFLSASQDGGLVNIYGGCCGTTPEHIRALARVAKRFSPRPLPANNTPTLQHPHPTKQPNRPTTLSGLEPLRLCAETGFINIGERTNVAGSAKFKRLIQEKKYEEALSVARNQVENGAQVIDICMDDGLIDGVQAMTTFLNLIASEPDIARVPVMIDSSKWEILQAGLQCVQGKSIVNSISLKEGEEKFLSKARYVHSMGAAAVVMLFDEEGQADSYERKVSVARRAYRLLRGIGFPGEDIIFDPNVLAVATGMAEHDDYGRAFIEACRTIHSEMPEVHMSGGISNLSFSFRGNNVIRQAMHSVFLYHAIGAGLDMSIVNPAMTTIYTDIPQELLRAVEDVVLNRDKGAGERLTDLAQRYKEAEEARKAATQGTTAGAQGATADDWRNAPIHQRIGYAMMKGVTEHIEADTEEAYHEAGTALAVIDNYLMPAMEKVGTLFGEGKMFLPQVVKSARVMKKAVAVLEPYMKGGETEGTEAEGNKAEGGMTEGDNTTNQATILMATVKGDVHDIGKNIVGVVTQCNGYNVIDLGVMVDTDTIISAAKEHHAAVIGLSGLITPSLDEMIRTIRELQQQGMSIPVIVGGATTSPLHTAVKMAPEYPDGVVIHAHAAADNPTIIRHLLAEDREEYIATIKAQQHTIRENYTRRETEKATPLTISEARSRRHVKRAEEVAIPTAEAMKPLRSDNHSLLHPKGGCLCCDPLVPLINWQMFLSAWGLKGHFPEILSDEEKGAEAQKLYRDAQQLLEKIIRLRMLRLQMRAQILPAYSEEDDIVITAPDGKAYRLPMQRSLRDEAETKCLADYLMQRKSGEAPPQDYVCPFIVSAGVGLTEIQERYRAEGDEYHAMMLKLLADRLAEAMAEKLSLDIQNTLHWGKKNIRMAFGYSSCPDHTLKRQVFSLLGVGEETGLTLTDTCMINPGESICGLIFANTPDRFFSV